MPDARFRIQPAMLRSFPPGGWMYRQMETQWMAPGPLQHNFHSMVDVIVRHRKANPQYQMNTDPGAAGLDLEEYTAKRILDEHPNLVHQWLLPMNAEAVQKKTPPQQQGAPSVRRGLGAALAHAVNRLRRDVRAARILADWLGKGAQPVSPEQAIERAAVCAKCPHNKSGHALESATAEAIRRHVEVKRQLNLQTPHDANIDTCDVCGCHLRLKVWVPFQKAKQDSSDVQFPPNCWISTESEGLRNIRIQRMGSTGDVIVAAGIAEHLHEQGYDVTLVCEPQHAPAVREHPHIKIAHAGRVHANMDASYERNTDLPNRHIYDLMWEHALPQLRNAGIQTGTPKQWFAKLRLLPHELAAKKATMPDSGVPKIAVVPKSAHCVNRQVSPETWLSVARILKDEAELYWTFNGQAPGDPIRYSKIHDFRDAMAVMANCDLVCTVDTGPMHAAGALQLPILAIEQAFPIKLRLTDKHDWQKIHAHLPCIGCSKYFCPIDKEHPPCCAIDPHLIADGIRTRLGILKPNSVAAVIPSYNTDFRRLTRCVEAIKDQVDEIIVAVDGHKRLAFQHPKVRVIQNPHATRTGYGATVMRGARLTNTQWILFLNDDCYMDPGSVRNMLACADQETAIVGCLLRYPNGLIQHGGVVMGPDNIGWGHRDHNKREPSIRSPVDTEGVTFASALVRRKAFYQVGGFDLRFDCYCEDADLCMTIRQHGWKIRYTPLATGIHEESVAMGEMKNALAARSNEQLLQKWMKR